MHLKAIRDVLLASPTVVTLVGTRIYPSIAPQDCARPFVVLTLVSNAPETTHDDTPATALESPRVQVRCYGPEYAALHAVSKALDDVVGALQGTPLSATKEGEQEGYEDETSLHYVSMDFFVKRTRG